MTGEIKIVLPSDYERYQTSGDNKQLVDVNISMLKAGDKIVILTEGSAVFATVN